jgi:kinesin family protein 6/9
MRKIPRSPCSVQTPFQYNVRDGKVLEIYPPKNHKSGYVNNNKVSVSMVLQQDVHELVFTHVFPEGATQEDVYGIVAQPVIEGCLDGYNGTIFAYGQTGSGKTYTMSGAESWKQRGIIPRAFEVR